MQHENIGDQATILGHPRGLFYLFFAELWERFSFYGMRALLTLYMTKQLLFEDNMAFGVYAAYMSLVYITPSIGGMVADKILGFRKSILLGGILMAIGHFILTIETPFFFYTALSVIIIGNGFFKPNISSFVGKLYAEQDTRRDAGFTIFYMGINIGGAAAPLLCAWIAELYGWHYGFMLAGIGMLIGLFCFRQGLVKNIFEDKGRLPNPEAYYTRKMGLTQGGITVVAAVLAIPVFALLVRFYQYEHYLVWATTILLILMIGYIYRSSSSIDRKRLLVCVYFTVLATLFMAIFEQAGSSLTLFADRNVNLIGLNASQTNSINSMFIILLAIPFAMLWKYLSAHKINPNSAIKLSVGLVLLGFGFVIFGASSRHADHLAQTPMIYLIIGYFVLTAGELFLSPIGLSKMTELSPVKYVAFIMGVWFSSSFYGHYFAGKIATLTTVSEQGSNVLTSGLFGDMIQFVTGLNADLIESQGAAFAQLYSYVSVYTGLGIVSIEVGLVGILISPFIKKLMSGVE